MKSELIKKVDRGGGEIGLSNIMYIYVANRIWYLITEGMCIEGGK